MASIPSNAGRGKRGFGRFVLVLLVLAIAACGGAMIYFHETPQQFWKRLVEWFDAFAQPKRAPLPSPTPTPTATPAPAPTPVPEATPTPPLPPDPLAWLAEHRNYWPKEVVLSKEVEFPAVINGKVTGSVKARPGTRVQLALIETDAVGVVYMGGGARISASATDLPQRAEAAMAKAAADEAAPAAAPAATATPAGSVPLPRAGSLVPMTVGGPRQTVASLKDRKVTLSGSAELHLTGAGDPLEGCTVHFTSPDAWLFMEKIAPSLVAANFLNRMWVDGVPADVASNIRVVQFREGAVLIPHGPDFAAMTAFSEPSLAGASLPLRCYEAYDDASLGPVKATISSFRLKRGYEATIAENEDGTGFSKNYVAQDYDLLVKSLPAALDNKVRFVRIFPWRWVQKKGVGGKIWQNLNVGWYYNWNINDNSSPDIEYVPIRQGRLGPRLTQDWRARGATHLLGYNEPDQEKQANITVDDAIAGWPELLKTGLRVGSPAVATGGKGLAWLYEFMQKADAASLRVDFVAVHYYGAVPPGDAVGAASRFYKYIKEIHDRTRRPIWVTEWNNGAPWTKEAEPNAVQQRDAIREMAKMLDRTPFVERYAIFNWVEGPRVIQRADGSLTPAGEVYRDHASPLSYRQERP